MKKETLFVIAIAFCALLSCNKKSNATKETLTKDDVPTQYQGIMQPGSLQLKNDSVTMALYPSAPMYYLDLRLKGSSGYYALLKQATQKNIPVRIWVFKEDKSPIEVAKVEPVSDEELLQWKKAESPREQ
ncbi:hypothetical protein [Niabella hirudinis]|uniref:hypothetical protein n=1 Tax=Niabella hirudinis TaxID=1285929 RepID=UPI003EB9A6B3